VGTLSRIQWHDDRVAVSFCDDADDVDCIVTVALDLRVVTGLSDAEIIAKAREYLITHANTQRVLRAGASER
jgi:predicted RNA polymerase sigma factor